MAIYIVVYIFALAGIFTGANKNNRNKKIYLTIVFGCLLLVSMLRSSSVGTDMSVYYSKYYPKFAEADWDSITRVTRSGHWEWGYCALNKLLCYFSTEPQFLIIVTSIISIIPVAVFIYKNSGDVVFSAVFFVGYHIFAFFLNATRQSIAFAIALFGIEKLKQKQYFFFLVYSLIAAMIHTSSAVCLIMLILDRIELKKNDLYLLTAATVAIVGSYDYIVTRLFSLNVFGGFYNIYQVGVRHAAGYTTIHTVGMFLISLYVMIVAFINYKRGKTVQYDDIKNSRIRYRYRLIGGKLIKRKVRVAESISNSNVMYGTYLTMLFRMGAFFVNVTARLAYYFMPYVMIGFPRIVNADPKNKRVYMSIMYLLLTAFFLYILIFRGDLWGVTPYKFFWQR